MSRSPNLDLVTRYRRFESGSLQRSSGEPFSEVPSEAGGERARPSRQSARERRRETGRAGDDPAASSSFGLTNARLTQTPDVASAYAGHAWPIRAAIGHGL